MSSQNENKNRLLKIRAMALTLATVTVISGCSKNSDKNEKNKENDIGYLVEDSIDNQNGLYNYIIDRSKLEIKNNDSDSIENSIVFARITKREEYGTKLFNTMSLDFYMQNLRIVWPESFIEYKKFRWLGDFDFDIICEEFTDYRGEEYIVIRSSMTAKHDINPFHKRGLFTPELKLIDKGDNLSSTAIYCDGELVAFNQNGFGCDSENVVKASKGDVASALYTFEEANILSETEKISYDDLIKYESNIKKLIKQYL